MMVKVKTETKMMKKVLGNLVLKVLVKVEKVVLEILRAAKIELV
ncbi:hypothetical protein C621_0217420 [Bacillus thuringiensis serovar aizawai str. Leapi01]|nr:hypothetical protein C621_0217420 [Bacillus thuringiensis serovar aizawai str. Leapi01]